MSFYKTKVVDAIPALQRGHLFNSPKFHEGRLNPLRCFLLENSEAVVVRIVFTLHEKEAISGFKATFGSFDLFDRVPEEVFIQFLQDIRSNLSKSGIQEITIHQPALIYPGAAFIEKILLQTGFKESVNEVNQHIEVSEKAYGLQIKKTELSKLKLSQASGFTVHLAHIDYLPSAYALIKDTHLRKGYPVSLSYDELSQVIKAFPDRYLLFCLFDGDLLIATTVSIQVCDAVIYNFYHGDHFAYRSRSPLVLLIGEIYRYCQQHGIRILDLGISTVGGVLNEGLFNFKKHLGSEVSAKKTYCILDDE